MQFGNGNNNVTGFAKNGTADSSSSYGIRLISSSIEFGNGDDTLTGESRGGDGGVGIEIDANSEINTGFGSDRVNAIRYGNGDEFKGGGTVNLGADNDQLLGFGAITADGGQGEDSLLLSDGDYRFDSGSNTLSKGAVDMVVMGFEFIGGRQNESSDLLALPSATTFTIEDGILA